MGNKDHGLIDNRLRPVKDVGRYTAERPSGPKHAEKPDLPCALNVMEQPANVCHPTIVHNAWKRGAELSVHGRICRIENGIPQDPDTFFSSREQPQERNSNAYAGL